MIKSEVLGPKPKLLKISRTKFANWSKPAMNDCEASNARRTLLDPLPTTSSLQFTTRRAPIDRDTKPEPLNPMLSATNHQPFNPSLLNRSLDESVLLDVSSQNDDAAWTEEMARDGSSGGYGG
ncbi:hypothetical protein Bca4012_063348 [Brassica carinata]